MRQAFHRPIRQKAYFYCLTLSKCHRQNCHRRSATVKTATVKTATVKGAPLGCISGSEASADG
jgi:hypothetical protein